MKENEMNVEKFLHKDAESIEIDEIYKRNLKKRIMAKQTKKPFYSQTYVKAASVLLAMSLFGGGISLVAKQDPSHSSTLTAIEQKEKKNDAVNAVNGDGKVVAIQGSEKAPNVNPQDVKIAPVTKAAETKVQGQEEKPVKVDQNGTTKTKDTPVDKKNTDVGNGAKVTDNDGTKSQGQVQVAVNTPKNDPQTPVVKESSKTNTDGKIEQHQIASVDSKVEVKKVTDEVTSIRYLEIERVKELPEDCVAVFNYNTDIKLIPFVQTQSKFTQDQNKNVSQSFTAENQYVVLGVSEEQPGKITKQYNVIELGPFTKGNNEFSKIVWSKDGKCIYMVPKNNTGENAEIFKITMEIQ